jgi:hypothetical protein
VSGVLVCFAEALSLTLNWGSDFVADDDAMTRGWLAMAAPFLGSSWPTVGEFGFVRNSPTGHFFASDPLIRISVLDRVVICDPFRAHKS